jgi:proteasome accessory factor C
VAELARELGLAEDELRADIDLLGMIGRPPFSPDLLGMIGRPPFSPDDLIDISVDARGRVTVALDQSFSRPPQLTGFEALALTAAAQEVAPADPAVVSALQKLTARLPRPAREMYAALARRVAAAAPPPRGTEELLARLRRAAEVRREVLLEYDKEGRGASEERRIRPLAVIDHVGRWYVVGYDVGRSAERTFRLDRVRAARETGETFPDPGPLDAGRFQRATLFFPTGAERPVTFRFSPAVEAWTVARHGERARRLPGGGAETTIESAGVAYAVQLALSFAGEAEVIAPPEAREAVRDAAARALERYDETVAPKEVP